MVLFVKQFMLAAPLRWLRTIHVWLHHKSLNVYTSKSPQKGQHLATKFLFIYLLSQPKYSTLGETQFS